MSGIGSQLGIKKESTYGVPVTVDKFQEFDSFELSLAPNYTESTGLRAGTVVPSIDRHRETTRHATGSLTMKVPNQGFGTWVDLLHNATVTPQQIDGSAAYRQVHPVGGSKPRKSATIQVAKESAGGAVVPYTYPGVVVGQAEFSMEQGGDLMVSFEATARDELTSEPLASASYPAGIRSFISAGADGVVGTELRLDGSPIDAIVRSWTLTVPIPYASERWGIRRDPLKARPIVNDYVRPTCAVTLEFENRDVYDLWRADQPLELVIDARGDKIADDYDGNAIYESVIFTQHIKLTAAPTPIAGPDLITQEAQASIFYDGSHPPVEVEIVSLDAAL